MKTTLEAITEDVGSTNIASIRLLKFLAVLSYSDTKQEHLLEDKYGQNILTEALHRLSNLCNLNIFYERQRIGLDQRRGFIPH